VAYYASFFLFDGGLLLDEKMKYFRIVSGKITNEKFISRSRGQGVHLCLFYHSINVIAKNKSIMCQIKKNV